MVNVNGDGNVKMSNASPINDVNMIRRKMKNIYANMTGCKMNDVRLKLQYKQNSNGCRTTKTGCSKNRLGGGAYGTAYKAYANNGKTVPLVVKESTKQNKDDQESKIEHDTIKFYEMQVSLKIFRAYMVTRFVIRMNIYLVIS